MARIGNLLVFLVIITSIYFLMNWYALGRLAFLFGIKRNIVFYLVVAGLSLSLFAGVALNTRFGDWFTGAIFSATTMWLGICFVFVWCLFALQVAGWFVKMPPMVVGIAAVGIVGLLTFYAMMNAPAVQVRKVEIAAPVNLRIAQISDVHIGSTSGKFFSGVIDKLNELRPDMVLITGDLIDNDKASTVSVLENLNRLTAPAFFVTGNHERYVGYDNVRRLLGVTRLRWLEDEAVTVDNIRIVGVSDNTPAVKMDGILGNAKSDAAYTVLMYHRPEWLDTAARHDVNLMLTGHTHYGQIWPFNLVVGSFYKYIRGLHEIGKMHLYVCTGTGTWGPRMRLGSHSEIVLINLKNAQ